MAGDRIVALVPYRPETNAWKVLVRSGADIFVLEDRLRFGGRSYISPSVSAVVVLGVNEPVLSALGQRLPRHHRLISTGAVGPRAAVLGARFAIAEIVNPEAAEVVED